MERYPQPPSIINHHNNRTMSEHLIISKIKIEPEITVIYQHDLERCQNNTGVSRKTDNEKYTGTMTLFAKKNLKKALDRLVYISREQKYFYKKNRNTKKAKMKLNFVTLTLPSPQNDIPDQTITALLSQFLDLCRHKYSSFKFVWRAERQKNNNIHYHIITNTYMPHAWVRGTWNRYLSATPLLDEFEKKWKHRNPNSTDIHAVRYVRNVTAYATKYILKDNQEKICGKIWDCSKSLKAESKAKYELSDTETRVMLNNLQPYKCIACPYCFIFFVPAAEVIKYGYDEWVTDFEYNAKIWSS